MRILAFDPGLNLGWAVVDDPVKRHLMKSGFVRNNSSHPLMDRVEELSQTVKKLMHDTQPDQIVVEAVNRVGGGSIDKSEFTDSSWVLYWVFGEILRQAHLRGIPVNIMSPSQMKAACTEGYRAPDATGMASKDEVKAAIIQIYGPRKTRSDEFDAIGLAIAFARIYTKEYIPGTKKKRKKNAGTTA